MNVKGDMTVWKKRRDFAGGDKGSFGYRVVVTESKIKVCPKCKGKYISTHIAKTMCIPCKRMR